MGEYYDVRILSATYSVENGEVVMELFGRTRDEKSITVRYIGFRPYFFAVTDKERVKQYLGKDEEIVDYEEVKLWVKGENRICTRIIMRHPWLVPKYRERLIRGLGVKVLAADIPFHHRFMYDLNLGSCIRVKGNRLDIKPKKYTTDIVVECTKPEELETIKDFKVPLKMVSFDIENSMKDEHIFVVSVVYGDSDGNILEKKYFDGEEDEIIRAFIDYIRSKDPDIITGYNIDGYDLPLLKKRASVHGINTMPIGRNDSDIKLATHRFWRVPGRIVADAWWNVKRELKPKQETLNAVAKLVLNEEKLDVERTNIDEEWEHNRKGVIEYCIKDSELAMRIIAKLKVFDKYMDLSTVSKLPLDDAMNSGTSTLIDSILIRAADRQGIGVPCNAFGQKSESITGGYVHAIQPGLYDWVLVLDFKSMYPSIIIANNICFTTLSKDGDIVCTETGARFLNKDVKEGLIPRILSTLMKDRDETKRLMKMSQDERERAYYNGLQNAIKILMNSFYGVMASNFYRFTNPLIGASITAFARENIKNVINALENDGYKVIYSDTDSVFFQSPEHNLEGALKVGQSVAKRFSKGGIILEFEKVLNPLFSHGVKKRYVGRIVWPKEDIIVRGYEIRRTDAFDLQSESLQILFNYILDKKIEEGIAYAKEVIKSILRGEVPIEKLVISKTVRARERYKNPDQMANVIVADKLRKMGFEVVDGMKVSYIVVDSKSKPQHVEPYIEGRKFEYEPDWNYYARRVAQSLSRVTEVFGWGEDELISGVRQHDLFSSFENVSANDTGNDKPVIVPRKSKKVMPKKKDGIPTLDDFM